MGAHLQHAGRHDAPRAAAAQLAFFVVAPAVGGSAADEQRARIVMTGRNLSNVADPKHFHRGERAFGQRTITQLAIFVVAPAVARTKETGSLVPRRSPRPGFLHFGPRFARAGIPRDLSEYRAIYYSASARLVVSRRVARVPSPVDRARGRGSPRSRSMSGSVCLLRRAHALGSAAARRSGSPPNARRKRRTAGIPASPPGRHRWPPVAPLSWRGRWGSG
jgi:hypothetical protein